MIQASIQLSPKSKVVDFLVLYNFYFDQILSANVKFRELDGQSRLKIPQLGHCASPVCAQLTADLGVDASTRRRVPVKPLTA